MTTNKNLLLEQMQKQRTLPVTEETFALYHAYQDNIDPHNPDDLAYLLFYQGECHFRLGNFKKALSFLTRCLKAPKKRELKYLDAWSYHILSLINCYLGSETIALNYILQCRTISEELHLKKELISSYIDQGLIYYYQLNDFDQALQCLHTAYQHLNGLENGFDTLYVFCESIRGVLLCKTGKKDKALQIQQKLDAFPSDNTDLLSEVCLLTLRIHLYDYTKDASILQENLRKLSDCLTPTQDLIVYARLYFDVLFYLIKQDMQKEALFLMNDLEPYINRSMLIFLKHEYLHLKADYAKRFAPEQYPDICDRFITLQPAYIEEQRIARLYSLSYVELLRKTKIDSEHFQEKSQLDQMTGLLNKYTIQFLIEEDLSKDHSKEHAALLLVDLDHFKKINDTMGHLMGDEFICQTASVIKNHFKDTALCGRVGGDEFLVYISHVSDPPFIQLQAEILLQEIHRQTSAKKLSISTQASIGIAFSSEKNKNFEHLFAAADDALYQAKTGGRNKIMISV